jgi:hypothetical protein
MFLRGYIFHPGAAQRLGCHSDRGSGHSGVAIPPTRDRNLTSSCNLKSGRVAAAGGPPGPTLTLSTATASEDSDVDESEVSLSPGPPAGLLSTELAGSGPFRRRPTSTVTVVLQFRVSEFRVADSA